MANEILPFRTDSEAANVLGPDSVPPALVFNSDAPVDALLGAATERAVRLHRQLFQWACVEDGGGWDASQLAEVLEPLAAEVTLVMDRLAAKVRETTTGVGRA